MSHYNIAGQEISFSCKLPDLKKGNRTSAESFSALVIVKTPRTLVNCSNGWVAGADRSVKLWSMGEGLILQVEGFRDFYIGPKGQTILPVSGSSELTRLEQEVVLGPGLVLALVQGGRWCLHCSAALFHEQGNVFLGESGYGKSTLASFLHNEGKPDWKRIADDILPVTLIGSELFGWAHFPQLKLSLGNRFDCSMPEKVKLNSLFVLSPEKVGKSPTIRKLTEAEGLQVLLGHTAAARLFSPKLLTSHLEFCAQAARQVAVFRLSYPHRWDILPVLKEILEQSIESPTLSLN